MSDDACDVAVIGAGPAGAACARGLARRGLSVTLFDAPRRRGWRVGETAGPGLALALRQGLDLEPPAGTRPLRVFASAWGATEPERRDHLFWAATQGALLDRADLDAHLKAAAEASGAQRIEARVRRAEPGADGWRLHGDQGLAMRARFVVEATGDAARSPAAADVVRRHADALVCLSAVVEGPARDDCAAVAALPEGWAYAAELPGGRRLVAVFTDADLLPAQARRAWMEDALRRAGLAPTLPEAAAVSVACARTSIRSRLWRGAWLPVGDAAWKLDPLSGDGVERAVRDGAAAAAAIADFLSTGETEVLRAHALARGAAFQAALAARARVYAGEGRWPDAPFWRRRRA